MFIRSIRSTLFGADKVSPFREDAEFKIISYMEYANFPTRSTKYLQYPSF